MRNLKDIKDTKRDKYEEAHFKRIDHNHNKVWLDIKLVKL